ncbi:Hypothetical predicted protein [Pelobates cultripes]|uniref:Uncharacterized protein n=1 Tax=Pelobates cultripes TaxID=61616 RepID=A0AAD1REF2_PELCU|nr:Hypothetical predicted protein [Pelobates cultripes]
MATELQATTNEKTCFQPPNMGQNHPEETLMLTRTKWGEKQKKLKPKKPRIGIDIGELLRQAQDASGSKIAFLYGGCSDFYDETSDEAEGIPSPAQLDAVPTARCDPHTGEHGGHKRTDGGSPQKKIKNISIRETLQGFNRRLGAVENTTDTHDCQITELQRAVQELKQQNQLNELHLPHWKTNAA